MNERITFGSTVREPRLTEAPSWLGRVRTRLDCWETPPTLDELIHHADVHPRHLMRVFRRFVGCSIGEYLRRHRIRHAQGLLQTPMSLASVAAEVGFFDQSHFAKAFKRITGMTPGEYRRLTGRFPRD